MWLVFFRPESEAQCIKYSVMLIRTAEDPPGTKTRVQVVLEDLKLQFVFTSLRTLLVLTTPSSQIFFFYGNKSNTDSLFQTQAASCDLNRCVTDKETSVV